MGLVEWVDFLFCFRTSEVFLGRNVEKIRQKRQILTRTFNGKFLFVLKMEISSRTRGATKSSPPELELFEMVPDEILVMFIQSLDAKFITNQ